jgi:hypothetical protein
VRVSTDSTTARAREIGEEERNMGYITLENYVEKALSNELADLLSGSDISFDIVVSFGTPTPHSACVCIEAADDDKDIWVMLAVYDNEGTLVTRTRNTQIAVIEFIKAYKVYALNA